MRVDVDEARRHDETVGRDLHAGRLGRRPGRIERDDAAVAHPDVGREPCGAGAVDHGPASDDDVEHVGSSLIAWRGPGCGGNRTGVQTGPARWSKVSRNSIGSCGAPSLSTCMCRRVRSRTQRARGSRRGDERVERGVDVVDGRQMLGEHERVFEREAAALRERRRARVRGVADEQHPPGAPLIAFDLLGGTEVDGVGIERGQRVGHRRGEVGEPLAHFAQPRVGREVEGLGPEQLRGDVRLAVAEREHGDEPVVVEHHGGGVDDLGVHRHPPVHLPDVARRRGVEAGGAHLRPDAVGADDEVVATARAVGERDLDRVGSLGERDDRRRHAHGRRGGRRAQHRLQPRPVDRDGAADAFPDLTGKLADHRTVRR